MRSAELLRDARATSTFNRRAKRMTSASSSSVRDAAAIGVRIQPSCIEQHAFAQARRARARHIDVEEVADVRRAIGLAPACSSAI